MKRQLLNVVSHITVFIMVVISMCGCEKLHQKYDKDYTMTVSFTSDAGDDFVTTSTKLPWPHQCLYNYNYEDVNRIVKKENNTIEMSMYRIFYNTETHVSDDILTQMKLHLLVSCDDGEIMLNKRYPLEVDCTIDFINDNDNYYHLGQKYGNTVSSWIEFSKVEHKAEGEGQGWDYLGFDRVYLTGHFECNMYDDLDRGNVRLCGEFSYAPVLWK